MEARLTRLYERLGPRYVTAMLLVALGLALGWVAIVAAMGARYWGLSVSEYALTVVVVWSTFIPVIPVGRRLLRKDLDALRSWIERGDESGNAALEIQHTAIAFPMRFARVATLMALPLTVPVAVLWILSQAEAWEAADVLVLTAGCLISVLAATLYSFYCVAVGLRPLLADVAAYLPAIRVEEGLGVGAKLLLGLFALISAGGLGTGALVREPGTGPEGLLETILIAFALSLTWGSIGVFVIANVVLGPIRDLIGGTKAVSGGDLDAFVPVTSSDETGELAASFNEMMAGLRERARLADENVELLEEVRASRARIISASDAERRRVERNLHDGAQQRLVAHALELRMIEERANPDAELRAMVEKAGEGLKEALDELRELARGLHPQVLSTDGLRPALEQLANRAPVPVSVSAPEERFPDAVESTAYFVASEALANVAKYAEASSAEVTVARRNGRLCLDISDNGRGGADPEAGSGLAGLADRVAALDGTFGVESPLGTGTTVRVSLPLEFRGADQ